MCKPRTDRQQKRWNIFGAHSTQLWGNCPVKAKQPKLQQIALRVHLTHIVTYKGTAGHQHTCGHEAGAQHSAAHQSCSDNHPNAVALTSHSHRLVIHRACLLLLQGDLLLHKSQLGLRRPDPGKPKLGFGFRVYIAAARTTAAAHEPARTAPPGP